MPLLHGWQPATLSAILNRVSAYKRNLMVGATVLIALVLLGWMILQFSDAPFRLFAKDQLPVAFEGESAEGLSEGSPIKYRGMPVGRVTKIIRSADLRRVQIHGLVEPPLPGNVEGRIISQVFGGASAINLVLVPPNDLVPTQTTQTTQSVVQADIPPIGRLEPNQILPVSFVGVDLLPHEFTELSTELRLLSRQLREADLGPRLATAIESFRVNVDKIGKLIDSTQDLVGDEKMRSDIRQTLANFRATSESAKATSADLDRLLKNASTRVDEVASNSNQLLTNANAKLDLTSEQLLARLVQAATILDNLEQITRKANQGDGTIARLVNDRALYENLLDTSSELKLTITDVKRLVEQWEQEGMSFKLNRE